jgi:hypothetical protein
MKVYIVKFHMQMSSFHGPGWSKDEILGTYASEESAKQELDNIKKRFLSQGGGFKTDDYKDGHGFCGYHEAGSMSFVPGYWSYEEQEVKE